MAFTAPPRNVAPGPGARPEDRARLVHNMAQRHRRRMARYVLDGWTPGLLRALASGARLAGEEHWIVAAVELDADTLECFLTAQGLAGGK